jgi:hypothetical protein
MKVIFRIEVHEHESEVLDTEEDLKVANWEMLSPFDKYKVAQQWAELKTSITYEEV